MKVLVIGVLVLFVGYWMVQAPDSLAGFTEEAAAWTWDLITQVFGAFIDYLGSLFD